MTSAQLNTLVKKNPLPVACGVLSLILAGVIFWRSDAIPAATKELDEKSTLAYRYDVNLTNATQLKEQQEAISAAIKEIESRLIRPSQLGVNQAYFYKLESEYKVKLTDLRQNTAAPNKTAYVIPVGFTATVQGDFPAVLNFFQALEHGSHFCRVMSASCTGGRTGPVTLVLNLELLGQP